MYMELAKKYQVPIDTVEGPQQERLKQQLSRRDTLYRVLKIATGWFRNQLNSPCGKNALNYLKTKRHLSDGTLINFELGFAPDNWDSLLKYFINIEKVSVEILESAGLIVPRKGGNGLVRNDPLSDFMMIEENNDHESSSVLIRGSLVLY